jgi:hypothetical protein
MSSFLFEMEEEIPLSIFAMCRTMYPSHHDDSNSSYTAPKGKSVDPNDDVPDDDISYVSSSSNGAKKSAAATNGNKGTKATSTPKATKEKCQCKGCLGLPPTNLRPLVKCGIESCQKQLHRIYYEKMMDGGKQQELLRRISHSALLVITTITQRARRKPPPTTSPGRMMVPMGQMTQSVLSSTWWIGWQVKRGTCAGMTLLVP